MRRFVGMLVVLLSVAAAAFLLLEPRDPRPMTSAVRDTSGNASPVVGGASAAPELISGVAPRGGAPSGRSPGDSKGGGWLGSPAAETRLEGRVTRRDGTPVAGARVRAERIERFADEPLVAQTDPEGRYRFDDPPLGEWRVVVRGGGWVPVGMRDTPSSAPVHDPLLAVVARGVVARLDLVIEPAAWVVGRIMDERGLPVRLAEVAAHMVVGPVHHGLVSLFDEEPPPCDITTSDGDGVYELTGLVPGADYRIEARTSSLLPTLSEPLTAALDAPRRVDLTLRAGRWIGVHVLTEDGQPIRGAQVTAYAEGSWRTWRFQVAQRWETSSTGHVRVGPYEAQPVTVCARADGWLSDSPGAAPDLVVAVGTDAAEIRLVQGASVEGRVLGSDNAPVGGVSVQAQVREIREDGYSVLGLDCVTTRSDGTFHIDGLPPGKVTLDATLRGADPPLRVLVQVESGATDVLVRLAPDPLHVVLRIVGPDGRPIPLVTVLHSPMAPQEARDGRFAIESMFVDVHDLDVDITDPRDVQGRALDLAPAQIRLPKGKGGEVEVRLEPARAVAGRVVDGRGEGVGDVLVAFEFSERDVRVLACTQPDGAFRVAPLAAGEYTLRLLVPEAFITPPVMDVTAGSEDLRLVLRRGVCSRLTILDWNGQPVHGSTVELRRADGEAEDDSWDPFSEVVHFPHFGSSMTGLLNLPTVDGEVRYTLHVRPPGERSDLCSLAIREWRPQDTTVRLARARTVTGLVRDRDGSALGGAIVRARSESGVERLARADDAGRFEVDDLPEGVVWLAASMQGDPREGEASGAAPEVRALGGAREVVLVAERGLDLVLIVENMPGGIEPREATLHPEAESDGKISRWPTCITGRHDVEGVYRFQHLRAGARYLLWVHACADAPDLSLWIAGVRPEVGELRVRLVPGRTTRGRLLGLPADYQKAHVYASRQGWGPGVGVDPDGSFELRGLPEGRWTFTADASGGAKDSRLAPLWEGSIEAQAGQTLEIQLLPTEPDRR